MRLNIVELSKGELGVYPEYDDHERVIGFNDLDSGLLGYIAIHRLRGSLSTGGTRFYNYAQTADGLKDALRLSHAMTSKCVVSGLPYGGAKGVIVGNPDLVKSPELLHAYARVVDSLNGRFRTGEDVGMTEADVQILLLRSKFFNGKSDVAGDPSPFAAKSVFRVMSELAKLHLNKSLPNLSVAVRGVGKVGGALAEILLKDGAKVYISDINSDALSQFQKRTRCDNVVQNDKIPFLPVDIYAPCAMGSEITENNRHRFRSKMICGGANNQLSHHGLAHALEEQGILFVPDFLANAGGLINVSDELEPDGYHRERVLERIDALGRLAGELFRDAKKRNLPLSDSVEAYVKANL